jgi:hypothetical protein
MTQLTTPQTAAVATTGTWSAVGWEPPKDMDFDTWTSIGAALSQMSKSIHWWIGDWVLAGEDAPWGEKYAQALDATTFVIGTLQNDVFVCSRIPFSLRNEKLTFTHHYLVAGLETIEERTYWLEQTAASGWTTRQLREALREYKQDDAGQFGDEPEPGPPPQPVVTVEVRGDTVVIEEAPRSAPTTVPAPAPAPLAYRNGYEPQRWARAWRAAAYRYRKYARAWQDRAERLEKELEQLREETR